uniref:Uncharacterized protein n=1 Tax=Mesocestoides corti TaxID=53468 RepID=A0A5K3FII6_MESCO
MTSNELSVWHSGHAQPAAVVAAFTHSFARGRLSGRSVTSSARETERANYCRRGRCDASNVAVDTTTQPASRVGVAKPHRSPRGEYEHRIRTQTHSLNRALVSFGECSHEASPSRCKLPRSSDLLLPSRRSQHSQREEASTSTSGEGSCGDSRDEEVGKPSAASPCVVTKTPPLAVTPASPREALGRPVSMFADFSASPPTAASTRVRVLSVGSDGSKVVAATTEAVSLRPKTKPAEAACRPSVRQPPPTAPKSELAPLIKPEGVYPAIRLRPTPSQTTREPAKILDPSAEGDSSRHSRVCDLIKVFQQSNVS